MDDALVALEKENDRTQSAPALSKSRRRKNARQAAKARRAGTASLSETSTDPGVDPASLSEPFSSRSADLQQPNTPQSPQKRSRNRNKHKASNSVSRLTSPPKSKCQHEEKNAKALENREQYLQGKTEKYRMLSKKVEEVRQSKAAAVQQMIESLADKQKRAEEKRMENIISIKTKARDEALKVEEINFINHEKSQHRIHDVKEKEKKSISRQQVIEEGRARKLDDNKALVAAVEDRRKQQEQERAAKISEMVERKWQKIRRAEENLSKLRERVQLKGRDLTRRHNAIERAHIAQKELLLSKIRLKAETSAKLHEAHVELRRLRAQCLRSPRPGSAGPILRSEHSVQPDRCRSQIDDCSPERRASEDRIFAQMELDEISIRSEKLGVKLREKLLKNDRSSWPSPKSGKTENGDVSQALEILECLKGARSWTAWSSHLSNSMDLCLDRLFRQLTAITRSREKKIADDLKAGILKVLDIATTAVSLIIFAKPRTPVPEKPLCNLYSLLSSLLACDMFVPLLRTDVFVRLVEQARFYSESLILGLHKTAVPVAVFDACYKALEKLMDEFTRQNFAEQCEHFSDFMKYLMTCGLIQMMGRYHTLELCQQDGKLSYLRKSFQFTTWISRVMFVRKDFMDNVTGGDVIRKYMLEELSVYRDILKAAPVFGSVTLLYDLLRLGRSRPRCLESVDAELPEQSYRVAFDIIRMLNFIAHADLPPLQTAFRDLTLSIQLRHICSFLIQHCLTYHQQRALLLYEVVLLIGQFALLCPEHQEIVHAGHPPTLLQQLTRFPIEFSIKPFLRDVLLPTLIVCGYQNKKNTAVLEEELDLNHLVVYIKEQDIKSKHDFTRLRFLAEKTTQNADVWTTQLPVEEKLRYKLVNRFPKSHWDQAAQFFYSICMDDT